MSQILVRSGDIVITTMENVPILKHAAIVLIEFGTPFVWHMIPGKGILKESLGEFLKSHSIVEIRRVNTSTAQIRERINLLMGKKYHLFNFNCFSFVNAATGVVAL